MDEKPNGLLTKLHWFSADADEKYSMTTYAILHMMLHIKEFND